MKRFPRLRRFLFRAVIALILVMIAYWFFENRRGAKKWEEAQARVEKAGVSISRTDYAGPKIPGEDDLLKDPLFLAELDSDRDDALGSWERLVAKSRASKVSHLNPASGETVKYQSYLEGEMTEEEARETVSQAASGFEARLSALSDVVFDKPEHRIFSRSSTSKGIWEQDFRSQGTMQMMNACQSSALMAIREGDSARALERIRLLDRLSRISDGPTLVHYLVAQAAFRVMLPVIWEGIRLEIWSPKQIEDLTILLIERDLKSSFLDALTHELAWGLESLDRMNEAEEQIAGLDDGLRGRVTFWWGYGGLQGWRDRRKAFLVETYLDLVEVVDSGELQKRVAMEKRISEVGFSPLIEVSIGAISVARSIKTYAEGQTASRIALCALAAERDRMRVGSYPMSLSQMSLPFPVTDMTDPDGRALKYELGPNGRPQIWSAHEAEVVEEESGSGGREALRLRWQYWTENE